MNTKHDTKTGNISGNYETYKAAHRAADRKDNAYGAVRYQVIEKREASPMREAVETIFSLK